MKKVLFASTATAALAIGGMASAQGVALFGDARLGLGYNINNDGSVNGDEDLRAVSRVRFGVNMTGESDSGITFGATIRADNAAGGQGGSLGQTAGSVFVSGSWGTLTFGDTAGADENWVGDVPGNFSLTGLTDTNETIYVSNGGSFGGDVANDFLANPNARPTVRYDFDIAGFGISLSSNKELTDVGVGAGYAADFGGGSWTIGAGYYDFAGFTTTSATSVTVCVDDVAATVTPGACVADGETAILPGLDEDLPVGDGNQWSVGVNGDYESFAFGVIYTQLEAGSSEAGELLAGGSFGFDAFSVGAWYATILNADDDDGDDDAGISALDGDDSYGLSAQYDLGGGASINGGIAQAFGSDLNDEDFIADFGIKMAF